MPKKKQLPTWTYTEEETQAHVDRKKECRFPLQGWREVRGKSQTLERKEDLVFVDSPSYPVSMKIHVTGTGEMLESYRSAFILNQERIRGVDFMPVKNKRFFSNLDVKEVGWHENVLYWDRKEGLIVNDHRSLAEDAMESWASQDLRGFFDFCCHLWNIDAPEKERSLL